MKNAELQKKIAAIHTNIDILKHNYNVRNIGIFGSVARGMQGNGSDIDILVEFSEPVGFFKFVELEDYLSKILNRKVDLVTRKALKPAIKQGILREVVYA